jgi:phospholipid transport system transporter-binding protein
MSGEAQLTFSDDAMQLTGVLDFDSVVLLEPTGDAWLKQQAPPRCRLDMRGVSRANSAGTALLLAWLRTANGAGKQLRVEHLPDSLASLLHLAGLDALMRDLTSPT